MDKQRALNDKLVRLIGIPVLGCLIPNLSGLITNRLYSYTGLAASYTCFIAIAFVVWEGNLQLMHFIREKYTWTKRPYYKIIASLFFTNIIYSGLSSTLLLRLWWLCSPETFRGNQPI